MILLYIVACLVICWIGWFVLQFLVGFIALRSNPVRAGQTYIKKSLQNNSIINAGLIPDEAYKKIALLAYNMADLSHTVERKRMTDVYMTNLRIFIQQIEIVMSGHSTDLESNITNILVKYGVQIPRDRSS
ncbi:MAG: hypothetical protein NTZ16_04155 [Verrucomicrobia bacterium]|nr:hypothetical protein [Verrucomicrobiota bacterium]